MSLPMKKERQITDDVLPGAGARAKWLVSQALSRWIGAVDRVSLHIIPAVEGNWSV